MLKLITALAAAATLAAAPATSHAAPTNFDSGLGCSAECVSSALVQTTVSAARIDVRTDTPAHIEVVLRKRTAMGGSTPGGFTTGAIVASRDSGAALTRSFTTFATTLEPDTLYQIAVAATDAQGRRSTRLGTFRTKEPQVVGGVNGADTLKSDAGCSAQCITGVDATAGVTAAKFDVATNTPAKLVLQLSREAPAQTGLGPFFADGAERTYDATAGLRTSWRATLGKLRPGTRYHVIVRATDGNGNTSVRRGTVDTLERNVRVRFMEIRVTENGEKRSTNRGEITFVGGVNRKWQVKRGESKIKDGQRVHFSDQGRVELDGVRDPITFQVQGMERDRKGGCFDSLADPPYATNTGSSKRKCMKKVWNTAEAKLDPETIFALDSSVEPGFEGAGTLDTRIYATGGGVRFYVDVRIDVWTS